ncbi:very-long-chain 3-oxoacyl-CoA reductase-B-like isoform X3 [Mixophyes fleayi]|uniref:very-long-chain 3-oxoacyl-CoA reductase-B-like isoform X3 n=1 Tax=Mixophyes fleayi TaxID=3061075 RepID=UPI003F4E2504
MVKVELNLPCSQSVRSALVERWRLYRMSDCLLSHGLHVLGSLALSYLVLKQAWKLLQGFRIHILSRWWRTDLKKYGGWAELQTGRKTKIIQVDFTGGPEIYPKIEEGLKDLDVGVLVNNVGMTYTDGANKFLDVPDVNQRLTDIINCNIMSAVQMTRIVLTKMVAKKKGLIINISSQTAIHPIPLVTVYSATKVFVDYFSCGLNAEYKSEGITVQSVIPLLVSTPMMNNAEDNIIVKNAAEFAREALNTVGYTSRTSGCLSHSIQSYVLENFLPVSVSSFGLLIHLGTKINQLTGKTAKSKEQ